MCVNFLHLVVLPSLVTVALHVTRYDLLVVTMHEIRTISPATVGRCGSIETSSELNQSKSLNTVSCLVISLTAQAHISLSF